MDGTDARTGQHGDGGFRDHRHIYGDAVAFFNALGLHGVREPAYCRVEFLIGDRFAVVGVVAFPNDCRLIAACCEVTIQAIG